MGKIDGFIVFLIAILLIAVFGLALSGGKSKNNYNQIKTEAVQKGFAVVNDGVFKWREAVGNE